MNHVRELARLRSLIATAFAAAAFIAASQVSIAARGETVAPLSAADLQIFGARAGEEISDAAGAGDLDGDGTGEIILGSELAKVGAVAGAGRGFILRGGALPPTVDLASLGPLGTVIENRGIENHGTSREEHLGHAVAAAGDFNGDGFPDVIISAPNASGAPGRSAAGAVYVIFGGGPLPSSIDVSALGAGGVAILGAREGDHAGVSVSGAGDVNGDGYGDILIGADGADPESRFQAGAGYLVFGGPSLPAAIDLAALGSPGVEIGVEIRGAASGDALGRAVAGLGDFNGDGADDVAISAPGAKALDRALAGKVYVLLGAAIHPGVLDLAAPPAGVLVVCGAQRGDRAGSDVARGGDFNGDGKPDLLIGAPQASPNGRRFAGKSYVVFGDPNFGNPGAPASIDLASLSGAGVELRGVAGGDRSGSAIRSAGDFNGDGIDDLLIGAPWASPGGHQGAGQSYLVFGRAGPPARIELASLGAGGIYLNGARAGDSSGWAVGGAGDVDGDGRADLLVVAKDAVPLLPSSASGGSDRHSSSGRSGAGIAYLIEGRGADPVRGFGCAPHSGGARGVYLSWSFAAAYDSIRVDRNGLPLVTLPGNALSYLDRTPLHGTAVYEVFALRGGRTSSPARCEARAAVCPPVSLACVAVDGGVHLDWRNGQAVDGTRVYRDGELLASLGRDDVGFDDSAPEGEHEYRCVGFVGDRDSPSCVCHAIVPAPVRSLACAAEGSRVSLTWINGQHGYSGVRILRDGVPIATLGGSAVSYVDPEAPSGPHLYVVQGLRGDDASSPAACSVGICSGVRDLAGSSDAGAVTLAWTLGDGYQSIEIDRDGQPVAALDGSATSFVDSGLSPAVYEYRVIGISSGSRCLPASAPVIVPAPPSLSCHARGKEVRIAIGAGGACDGLELSRDGALLASLPASADVYLDTLPGPGTHVYTAVALCGNGRSAEGRCTVKPMEPPEDLDCSIEDSRIHLSWSDDDLYDAIEITVNGEAQPPLPGGATGADYELGEAGTVRVKIHGRHGDDESDDEECEVKAPEAPSVFACLASGLQVHLSWTNGAAYDSVRVSRDGSVIADLPGDAVSYDDVVAGPGAYEYRIAGLLHGSASLAAVCHARVIEAIAGLVCSSDGESVVLSWSLPSGADGVLVSRNGEALASLPPDAAGFTDPSPPLGLSSYSVTVTAGGNVSLDAACAVEILPRPGDFTCLASGQAVQLSWSVPAPYTTLVILRNGIEITPAGGLSGSETSFLDEPVSPGLYLYEIRGIAGAGAASARASCQAEVIILPIRLSCSTFDGVACLAWVNPRPYDEIEVSRDGGVIATLSGDATLFCDPELTVGDHFYEVRGVAGGSRSDAARCQVSVPESPSGFQCAQEGKNIRLRWVPLPGGEAVQVRRDGEILVALPGNAMEYLDADVPLGTHSYEIRTGVAGDFSRPGVCAVTMIGAPGSLSCVSDGSSVTLCWTPGAEYDLVTIRRNGAVITQPPLPGAQLCYTDPALTPGVYAYEVTGTKGSDESASGACAVMIVARASGFSCSIQGDGADLAWTNGAPYDSIDLLRKKPSDAAPVLLATLAGDRTSYHDSPLTEPGEYVYSLVGHAGGSASAPVSCQATLLRPASSLDCSAINLSVTDADVRLTWTDPEAFDTIVVQRNGQTVATLLSGATSYLDLGLSTGTYDYLVTGSLAGNSAAPAKCTVVVHLVPPPISGFNCRIDGDTAILAWTLDQPADAVKVYRRAPGEASSSLIDTLPGTAAGYLDPSAGAPGDYRYEVSAVKDLLESSKALCDVHKPKPAVSLTCLASNLSITGGDVRLSWTSSEATDSFIVLREGSTVATIPGNATSYVDLGLLAGAYSYQLVAVVGGSRSDPSLECSVLVPTQTPPPVALTCAIENGAAALHWTSGAVYDAVKVSRKGPGDSADLPLATLPGSATSYSDTAITAAGSYVYSVVGVIGTNESEKQTCTVILPRAPLIDPANCATQTASGAGTNVLIHWTNQDAYDSITLVRVRTDVDPTVTVLTSLVGDQESYLDPAVPLGRYEYALVGKLGGGSAASRVCPVDISHPRFIRGEINNDRQVNVGDPIYLINWILQGGPIPICMDAADANDNGEVDLSDAIWTIRWLFQADQPPFAPYPTCGTDPTPDAIDCGTFPLCQ